MTSVENIQNQPSGSEQKINEYAERIENGQDAGQVMQGLGSLMRDAIEKKLLQKEARKVEEQKRIEEIREGLGLPKKEKPDFHGDEQIEGIYNTFQYMAAGAKEGLQEDVERKIQKYVDEIKSGKDKGYVLQGIPEKWRNMVDQRLLEPEKELPQEFNIEKRREIGEQVLSELNRLSADLHLSGGYAIVNGTWNGDFRGSGDATLEVDENRNIVLRRGARDEQALIKEGLTFTNKQDLYESSLTNGIGNGVPTASNSKVGESYVYGSAPEHMGVFRIPYNEFLNLAKEGKIMLGNLGESEIIISPEVASRYLSEINGKKIESKDK